MMVLKIAGLVYHLPGVQSDVLSPSRMHVTSFSFSTDQQSTEENMLRFA